LAHWQEGDPLLKPLLEVNQPIFEDQLTIGSFSPPKSIFVCFDIRHEYRRSGLAKQALNISAEKANL